MAKMKENNSFYLFRWEFIIGLAILVATVWICFAVIDVELAVYSFFQLDAKTLFLITILGGSSWLLRGLRIWLVLEDLTLGQAIGMSFLHNSANNLAPMRIGELAFPALAKWLSQVKFSVSLTHLIWIRFLDFISLIGISLCIIAFLHAQIILLIALAVLLLLTPNLIHFFVPKTISLRLPDILNTARKQLIFETTNIRRLYKIWLLTVNAWLSKLIAMGIMLFTLSDEGLSIVTAIILGAELSSISPVHGFAGAGSYEAGGVFGAALLGVTVTESLTLTVQLHLYVLSLTVVFGILGYFLLLKRTFNG